MAERAKGRSAKDRARLRAIRAVDLEEARPVFERIARTAQRLSGAPIAHVSIFEQDTLWIAGVSDVPLPPVPREQSFVQYVVESDAVFWSPDLRADPRFDGNPFVHGEAGLRSYAGAPVRLSSGDRVGAISVIDVVQRPYDPELAAALEDLAALVALEWERGRAMQAARAGEAKARASNEVLARVIDSAPVALLMTDRKMRIVQTSYRWRRDMGAPEGDLAGRYVHEMFPGSEGRWGFFLDKALKGETIRSRRAQLVLPSGRKPWVRAEITPWRDRNGRIGGLLIMTHDITDMVEALEKVRRSEQTLKLALEIGELSMWELDHRDRQLNNAGADVPGSSGRTDYETMNRDIWFAVHPADRPAAMAAWERYERDGEPFRSTFRMLQRNGPHIWVESAAELIRDEAGRIERTVGVMRDIDKQRRSEIALARAKEEAEAANRAKSEFLANMSHEIRTPLNGVMGVASALTRTALDANQREMVGLIESSARTLESLLSDVLDLARVESGRLVLASEPFDLARCLTDVAALFQPSAEAKGLDLIVEATPEIDCMFLGDAARIRQILSNLVSNAVKFTSSGEVRLGATTLRTPHGVEARIRVRDTGIGFDDATKLRLFGRFEQADGSITRRFGGTGLGLAISRSLAEQMGGTLDAEATPGRGAVFTLTLPLARTADAPLQEALADAAPADIAPNGRRLRVLLAEDHPVNRRVVQLILEAAGVDLTCVEDGAAAVETWRGGDFDLVLMDMQMPVMDGLTAIREIRQAEARLGRPRTQICALTANAMPEHAEASRAAGADGHLTKPISADQLFRAVEDAARGGVGATGAAGRSAGQGR
ncbi:MAG TPA: ATP-binding protein [Caulobacteraceae bacterium]|nr:ATP-binding protein [Caulobacteraceae bacterium]